MKKSLLLFCQLFFSLATFAQDNTTNGYSVGKIAGFVVAAGFVVWGITWWNKRKKK